MANPKEKTRKGLFGRTITKKSGENYKKRTVTRETKSGVKTKENTRMRNIGGTNTKGSRKTRKFESKEGPTSVYIKEKIKGRDFDGSKVKSVNKYGASYDVKLKEFPEDTRYGVDAGKYSKLEKINKVKSAEKGSVSVYSNNTTGNFKSNFPQSVKGANKSIRQAKRMSRGRG
jgi:hypothetical protein